MIDETLSPTWDELLLFDDTVIYGTLDYLVKEPPTIVIEIFDQDKVVSYFYLFDFNFKWKPFKKLSTSIYRYRDA